MPPAKKAKNTAYFQKIADTRQQLVERFPACFASKGGEKRPLAIGINKEVTAACPDLDATDIWRAIRDYACGRKYLRHMVAGAERIGLDGQPSGLVSEDGAVRAAGQLRALEVKIAADGERQRARVAAERAQAPQAEVA